MNIVVEKFNSVSNKIHCEPAIARELYDYFTFQVPGARFNPLVKSKKWDGKIHLFHSATQLLYGGLNHYVEQFAEERNYSVDYATDFTPEEFTVDQARAFCNKLQLTLNPRDYQIDAFVHAVRNKRTLLLSPTASGKSLIIFLLVMYTLSKTNGRTLIVVPTTSLVHQMISDFQSYTQMDIGGLCQRIMEGHTNHVARKIVVSTWQSIYKLPRKWFDQFNIVVGDEAHLFKSKSLTSILSKLVNCDYRYGFTGTLDGTHTHRLVLEGIFGPVRKVITTAELIEQKHVADFLINCVVLQYSVEERNLMKKAKYKDEIDWIVRHPGRNRFIKNLAGNLKGNTLILFQFVEKHGNVLYDLFQQHPRVHYVHGKVDAEIREDIRAIVEKQDDAIIIASYGTFSTGVNIKNIHNIIFASPSKSRIRNLQSIGRGLRKSETKTRAVLYDIADDLSVKSWRNYTIQHMAERVKIYGEEKFEYKIHTIPLKG